MGGFHGCGKPSCSLCHHPAARQRGPLGCLSGRRSHCNCTKCMLGILRCFNEHQDTYFDVQAGRYGLMCTPGKAACSHRSTPFSVRLIKDAPEAKT